MTNRSLEEATERAKDAFWASVVQSYPAATSGDLSPEVTIALDRAMEQAVKQWVYYNAEQFPACYNCGATQEHVQVMATIAGITDPVCCDDSRWQGAEHA